MNKSLMSIAVSAFLFVLACPLNPRAQTKTLARIVDPIVIDCHDLAPLFGVPPEQLALMALDGNTWSPAPFQIDQRKPDGSYAYDFGPQAGPDPDPNLDANDELVFMAKDAGHFLQEDRPEEFSEVILDLVDPWNDPLQKSAKPGRWGNSCQSIEMKIPLDKLGTSKVCEVRFSLGPGR